MFLVVVQKQRQYVTGHAGVCMGSEFQTVGKLAPSRPLVGGEGDRCFLLKNPVDLSRLNIKLFWPQWFNPSRFLPLPAD